MNGETPKRSAVKPQDCWDLTPLYTNPEDWEKDFANLKDELPRLELFSGKLIDADTILSCFDALSAFERKLEYIYVWVSLKSSEDLSVSDNLNRSKRVESLVAQFSETTAYIEPELVKLADDFLLSLIDDERFAEYKMTIKQFLNLKPHVLSDSEERLLAKAELLWNDPYTIFSSFDNVDAQFEMVDDGTGQFLNVTHGNYSLFLEHRDRDIRQKAFNSIYGEYRDHIHVLADVLHSLVKQHVFLCEVRNYASPLVSALSNNQISETVYRNLISQMHKQLPRFYEYIEKRKQLLGLDKLAMWDLRVSLNKVNFKFSYEEAVDLCCAAAAPLGEDYVTIMRNGLLNGWVDRYENKGKRSGGFSSGCYDSYPYILMNYTGNLNDVFTLMHEAGHSMHSYLANKNQPYSLADYPIFTAEIASTVNERLLVNHLLEKFEGEEREAVLHYEIDAIRATFFRQTMFAEFELLIHEAVQEGVPLTKDFLCENYLRLNKLYYGENVEDGDLIQYEWARIPHFYYNFYVYQYATGIAAAYNFADRLLNGETEAYLNLLKSGGRDFPLVLLREAGVDLEAANFYEPIMARFEELVREL